MTRIKTISKDKHGEEFNKILMIPAIATFGSFIFQHQDGCNAAYVIFHKEREKCTMEHFQADYHHRNKKFKNKM